MPEPSRKLRNKSQSFNKNIEKRGTVAPKVETQLICSRSQKKFLLAPSFLDSSSLLLLDQVDCNLHQQLFRFCKIAWVAGCEPINLFGLRYQGPENSEYSFFFKNRETAGNSSTINDPHQRSREVCNQATLCFWTETLSWVWGSRSSYWAN